MHVAQVILGRRSGHGAVLAALVAVGCFSPALDSCLSCEGGGSCPSGQSCSEGYCVVAGQSPMECAVVGPPRAPDGADVDGDGYCGLGVMRAFVGEDVPPVCTGGELDIELRVEGGEAPYRWYLAEPVEGLSISHDGSSPAARLRGTLADVGRRSVAIGVESVPARCAAEPLVLALDVRETPRITAEPPVPCAGQNDYLAKLAAEGGDAASYTWSVSGLPGGLASEAGEIYSTESGSVALREPVELTLTLSDGFCGPVEQKLTWPANLDRECFTIDPPELPALCSGIEYRAQLASRANDPGQRWELLEELPAGLEFDTTTATLSGVPGAAGRLRVRLTGSSGQAAERSYELPLRDSCRFAYVAGTDARLHLRDVFLSGADAVLPATLGAGEAVTDFQFSPDGEWLVFRAGVPDRLRTYLVAASAAQPSATLIPLVCPGANDVCGVIDYAWAPSSRALALMVRGDIGGTQDYLTGIDVEAPEAPWAFLTQDTDLSTPFVFGGELDWVGEGHVAWIVADPFSPGQQAPFLATLAQTSRAFTRGATSFAVSGGQLGLVSAVGGFVTFSGLPGVIEYTALEADSTSSITAAVEGRGPWLSPSRERVARVVADGRLQILAFDGSVLDETLASVCGTVVAWSRMATGGERIVCSAVDADGVATSTDLTLIDYSSAGRQQSFALIPELEVDLLASRRRALSPSGNGFAFTVGEQLVLVNASQPQPITSARPFDANGIVDLQYVSDERLILQSGNALWLMNAGRPATRRDLAGTLEAPNPALSAAACQEEYSLSPSRWCGATSIPGAFAVSNDAHTILFEDDSAGLWITDVQADGAARQVTTDLAPCSNTVRAAWTKPCFRAYAFKP